MATVATGQIAPAFELVGTDGRQYSLATALVRGPVLAVFFKVSCPTCQYSLPFFERIYQQFLAVGAQGIQVWGISQDNSPNTKFFAKEFGITFPLLIDDEPYETSQEYGLTHVPSYFLITSDRKVEVSGDGFGKTDLLGIRKSLARHLSASPAELFAPSEQVPAFKPG